ncbi:MAG: hypothetical protein LKI39_11650 [Bacteroides sp.]|jgi:hypothetical protein|nr:hypothetical protein [Bacteroides sp.]
MIRHEDEHITIIGITMKFIFYDFQQTRIAAAHIPYPGNIVEILQAGYG